MKCPKCGLFNPDYAISCDCGHRFQQDERRRRSSELCPNCRTEIQGEIPHFCTKCGVSLLDLHAEITSEPVSFARHYALWLAMLPVAAIITTTPLILGLGRKDLWALKEGLDWAIGAILWVLFETIVAIIIGWNLSRDFGSDKSREIGRGMLIGAGLGFIGGFLSCAARIG